MRVSDIETGAIVEYQGKHWRVMGESEYPDRLGQSGQRVVVEHPRLGERHFASGTEVQVMSDADLAALVASEVDRPDMEPPHYWG